MDLTNRYIKSITLNQYDKYQLPIFLTSSEWFGASAHMEAASLMMPYCKASNQVYFCEIQYWDNGYRLLRNDEALGEINGKYLKILNVQQEQLSDSCARVTLDVYSIGNDRSEDHSRYRDRHINIDFCCKTDINIVCGDLSMFSSVALPKAT